MGSLAFVSNLRIEEYWSVEALECNGKICLMFVEVPRGSSSETSLGDGVATVNDLVIELGDSSSIALCLKNENPFEARFCWRLYFFFCKMRWISMDRIMSHFSILLVVSFYSLQ